MAIRIITDSAFDLPVELIKEYNIYVLPLLTILNGKEYFDQETIQSKELYEWIRRGEHPHTSQPPAHRMEECFEEGIKAGEHCIYLTLSSELSGTYQTANLVKHNLLDKYPDAHIDVIDTKAASTGQGLIVLHAAKLAQENIEGDQLLEAIHYDIDHMEHIFTVKDLDYLAKGGRLSKASAFLGGLLKIQPLLDVEDGKLIPLEKIRGEKKLYARFLDIMEERGDDIPNQQLAICHGDDLESANKLKAMIEERFQPKKPIIVSMIGSVIGSHSGPGTLAVFFLNK